MQQDWEVVTFKKKNPTKGAAGVEQARQRGAAVETTKKFNAGANKQRQAAVDARKLEATNAVDEDGEKLALKKVSREQAMAIQKARQAKGWTQKELGTRINEKPTVVNEYEQAKAIPNNQILSKMERQLGVKLRGKDIGEPLVKGGGRGK
ncbi:multiprotein-bridging factor 1 [Balamuthia mandrillaris]